MGIRIRSRRSCRAISNFVAHSLNNMLHKLLCCSPMSQNEEN